MNFDVLRRSEIHILTLSKTIWIQIACMAIEMIFRFLYQQQMIKSVINVNQGTKKKLKEKEKNETT